LATVRFFKVATVSQFHRPQKNRDRGDLGVGHAGGEVRHHGSALNVAGGLHFGDGHFRGGAAHEDDRHFVGVFVGLETLDGGAVAPSTCRLT
jgi:hypothetical protein